MKDDVMQQREPLKYEPFDQYPIGVERKVRVALEKHAEVIITAQHDLRRVSAEHVMRMGKALAAAQQLLAHKGDGCFGKWVEERCKFSRRLADYRIRAYHDFGECENVCLFDASALYELSKNGTPEPARKKAIEEARKGKTITHAYAKNLVKHFSRTSPPSRPVASEEPPEAPDAPELPSALERVKRAWQDAVERGEQDAIAEWIREQQRSAPKRQPVRRQGMPDFERQSSVRDMLEFEESLRYR